MKTATILKSALFLLISIISISFANSAHAQSAESKVKTAYIYTLLRGSTWPPEAYASSDSPYKIAILGTDDLGGLLDKVAAKKTIKKRKIELDRVDDISKLSDHLVLYIPNSTPDQIAAAEAATANKPILVIAEGSGMANAGAAISFYIDDAGTVAVEVNPSAAAKRNLEVDAKIMKIGTRVGG